MKAFEVLEGTAEPQYRRIIKKIIKASEKGELKIKVDKELELLPKVINRLSDDGFDIEMHRTAEEILHYTYSYIVISWENAKKGRNGILISKDEA